MTKEQISSAAHPRASPKARDRIGFAVLALLLVLVADSRVLRRNIPRASDTVRPSLRIDNTLDWRNIKPSTSLNFIPCFEKFECARLDVPLDWTAQPEHCDKRAAVAVRRLPTQVPLTDSRYGGAILINPGGPGGSGIGLLLGVGKYLQMMVDSPNKPLSSLDGDHKYFDIIGFDPRGVNNTTPSVACFPEDASMWTWIIQSRAQGTILSNESFANVWARQASLAQSCSWRLTDDKNPDTLGIGRFVSTPFVAEDMNAIIEALGEWREKSALDAIQTMSLPAARDVLGRVRWRKGQEKLFFWGMSYGTILGATFSALHPEKVGRMLLDGVVNSDAHYSGDWAPAIKDSDSVIKSFFEEYYRAGPDKCAMYDRSGHEATAQAFERVLASLRQTPLTVPAHGKLGPSIVTLNDLIQVIDLAAYNPLTSWTRLAQIVKELSHGNRTALLEASQDPAPTTCPSVHCINHPWSYDCLNPQLVDLVGSVTYAVLCTNQPDSRNQNREDYWQQWKHLESISKTQAGRWAGIAMPCANWDVRPAWKFDGSSIQALNTFHPILWLSNSRDPVTPLEGAYIMAAKFPGSVVYGQDADGHGTLSRPSICVNKRIREYFQTGRLPKGGIVCKPDHGPFDHDQGLQGLSMDDQQLYDAGYAVEEVLRHSSWRYGF